LLHNDTNVIDNGHIAMILNRALALKSAEWLKIHSAARAISRAQRRCIVGVTKYHNLYKFNAIVKRKNVGGNRERQNVHESV
jgi:hypothetical protein